MQWDQFCLTFFLPAYEPLEEGSLVVIQGGGGVIVKFYDLWWIGDPEEYLQKEKRNFILFHV